MKKREARKQAQLIALGVLWKELNNPSDILPDETDDTMIIYAELEALYYELSKRWKTATSQET